MSLNKFLSGLNLTLSLFLCGFFVIDRRPSDSGIYRQIPGQDSSQIQGEYIQLGENIETGTVIDGGYVDQTICESLIKIDTYVLEEHPGGFKMGEILKAGTSYGSSKIEHESRIISFSAQGTLLENLETTRIELTYSLNDYGAVPTSFMFSVDYFDKNGTVPETYDSSFDIESSSFEFTLWLDNSDGFYLAGLPATITVSSKVSMIGLFIPWDCVFYDEQQAYSIKVYRTSDGNKGEIIPLNVLSYFGRYVKVEGNLKNGNIVLRN